MDKDDIAHLAATLIEYAEELLHEKGRNKYTDALSFTAGVIQGQECKIRDLQQQLRAQEVFTASLQAQRAELAERVENLLKGQP